VIAFCTRNQERQKCAIRLSCPQIATGSVRRSLASLVRSVHITGVDGSLLWLLSGTVVWGADRERARERLARGRPLLLLASGWTQREGPHSEASSRVSDGQAD
jgi:hypothetical protein